MHSKRKAPTDTSSYSQASLQSNGFSYTSIPSGKKLRKDVQVSMHASVSTMSQSDVRGSNNTRLQMAIADMIHSDGLTFSFSQSKRFRNVLRLAKTVDNDFSLPGRHAIAGVLLDKNFQK